jgi:predicted transcriptional regulator
MLNTPPAVNPMTQLLTKAEEAAAVRSMERLMKMVEEETAAISPTVLLEMTVEIVASYLGHNAVSGKRLPEVLQVVHASLASIAGTVAEENQQQPAVPIKKSVTPDYIVCLEDGRKFKLLRRTLRTAYGMTPDEYREKWRLPANYPMIAPNYAQQRSTLAKGFGLGRKKKWPSEDS